MCVSPYCQLVWVSSALSKSKEREKRSIEDGDRFVQIGRTDGALKNANMVV